MIGELIEVETTHVIEYARQLRAHNRAALGIDKFKIPNGMKRGIGNLKDESLELENDERVGWSHGSPTARHAVELTIVTAAAH